MLYVFSSKPFYSDFVHQPRSADPPSAYIFGNPKFYPFFEDVIGAMDGVHFISSGTAEERALARDRKGLTTTNCLAGSDFDNNFTYLSTGWEGSVSDSTMYLLLLYYFPSLFILLITHFGLMLHTLLFVIVYTYMY